MAARPHYPDSLFKYISDYFKRHNNGGENLAKTCAIDIGCGPGEATVPLTKYFDQVIGIDHSQVMVNEASKRADISQLKFIQGSDKDFVTKFESNSVDLITVAQAIHWFQFPQFFNDAYKVLKPNGTLAFWGYVDHNFVGHPKATEINLKYCYDNKYFGPYWQQPGRDILRGKLAVAEPPSNMFRDIERYENFTLEADPTAKLEIAMKVPFASYAAYLKTMSSYHSWKEANPDVPDIADRCIEEIKEVEQWNDDSEVTMKWSTILVLATKKN